jgi:hypothetical protein
LQNARVDAFSIIAYAQAKLAIVVPDFSFDPARLRMLKGVSQNLACNAADFFARERAQGFSLALHGQPKDRCVTIGSMQPC